MSEQKIQKPSDAPFAHYRSIYQGLNPREIALRTALAYDEAASAFHFRLMGTEYRADFPDFRIREGGGATLNQPYLRILILRYLCEGMYAPGTGRRLAYSEIPWGDVYQTNFNGRVLQRLTRLFGDDLPLFHRVMKGFSGLKAEPLPKCDAGYRFEFMNGLFISLLLWAGDEEFPPAAQVLFDESFRYAFTAEDIAVVGELFLDVLKRMKQEVSDESQR